MRQPYGQNFLKDTSIAAAIVEALGIEQGDKVVEIGPGKGILTSILASKDIELTLIELDKNLAAKLMERYGSRANIKIVQADFMNTALSPSLDTQKFISNLPYYISTAIIEKILTSHRWDVCVLMVQREVGQRMLAKISSKEYGYFSIFTQYFAEISKVCSVKAGAFSPPPKVESVVLKFINKRQNHPDQKIFELIKGVFTHRRKTILNALSYSLDCKKSEISDILAMLGIDPKLRPESLDFTSFNHLTSHLGKYIISS